MIYTLKTAFLFLLKGHFKLAFLLFKKRYKPLRVKVKSYTLSIPDAKSFVFTYDEIWNRQIYTFKSSDSSYIIDAGANIGLSVLFFVEYYPKSQIIAFEPDPKICDYLLKNIQNNRIQNVQVIQKALWNNEGTLYFRSEGADGGHLTEQLSAQPLSVQTERLSKYIQKPVDMLKMDIEGAEYIVLAEIAPCLHLVKNIFIEYHSFDNQPQSLSKILDILEEHNFHVYVESIGIKSSRPLWELKTMNGMDLQLNIWGRKRI
ncbi:MAG: FkbM family methyltransferase [Cytophagales bacterium]|nr:MAG: FkbM family methyltransferase [Cytophagales bacterium]TAF60866.1 MAG: FkbM family methyltransferase [Cytophagales bacterium]